MNDHDQASPSNTPSRKRRYLQIGFFTLLVLLAIACVWVANKVRRRQEAVEAVLAAGGSVAYDYEIDRWGRHIPDAQPPGPAWLRDLVGIDYFSDVVQVHANNDVSPVANFTKVRLVCLWNTQVTDLPHLANLNQLRELQLYKAQVRDLSPLAKLTNLQQLRLEGTQATDLSPLAKLTELQYLSVSNMQVADLSPLAKLPNLQELYIDETLVSDLSPLARLTKLQNIVIRGSRVSPESIEQLQQALPYCTIVHK